jgi:protein involved in polysaccharide export with SLBB domain
MLKQMRSSLIFAILAFAMSLPSAAAPGDSTGANQALKLSNGSNGGNGATPTPLTPSPVRQQPVAAVPEIRPESPQFFDYSANLQSDVFGANLFTGSFARQGATQFNPDYSVAIGDKIQVHLWGAFEFSQLLAVDPKGNVFIPHAGPVKVLGVRNKDLQRIVEAAVARTFRNNVSSYASLAAAQPVRIYVSGFVNRPGLYSGTSMDSLLHYLDQAGGIDPERGSFLEVQVKRGKNVRATVNLYNFLLNGEISPIQLSDGDVIFITGRHNTINVTGLAENAKRFEYIDDRNRARTVADFVKLAKPRAEATHVRVVRNTGTVKNIEYYPLAQANRVAVKNGDELEFTADKKPGTITVRVEGEHQSPQEYVLPYGSRMSELLAQIRYSKRSDKDNIQLFRRSVKERQKLMLRAALKSLENVTLTARSGTQDEARLRKEEADLILKWIDRAKNIEPSGQVVIAQSDTRASLLLENRDIVRIPTKDGLVLVSGEVLFPNAIIFDENLSLNDYVTRAGGYTQSANTARIVISRRDGSYAQTSGDTGFFSGTSDDVPVRAGDEVLVLPKLDVKSRQIWTEMTKIVFQIAVAAGVVFGL